MDIYTEDHSGLFTVVHNELMLPGEYALSKYIPLFSNAASTVNIPPNINSGISTITAIGSQAFKDDDYTVTINIPQSVKYISPDAFHNVNNLRVIRINNPHCRISDTALEHVYGSIFGNKNPIMLFCHPNSVTEEFAKFLRMPSGIKLDIKYFSRSKLKQCLYDPNRDEER